jgi:hypothetical protein
LDALSGPLPPGGDPGQRLVEDLSRIVDRLEASAERPEAIRQILLPVLTEIREARQAIERVADRPMMDDRQVRTIAVPALLKACTAWQVVASMAVALAFFAAGFGLNWWLTPSLTCGADRGGVACFYWVTPPTEPAPPAEPAQPAPQTKTGRQH